MAHLIIEFPKKQKSALAWWHVEDQTIIEKGDDYVNNIDINIMKYNSIIALLPSDIITIQNHAFENLTSKQAMMVAKLEAQNILIDSDQQFIVSEHRSHSIDGHIKTISTAHNIMSSGIEILQNMGLNPDIITPASLLFANHEDENIIFSAQIGHDKILWMQDAIFTDEPSFREAFINDQTIEIISEKRINDALINLTDGECLNLRQGIYKKGNGNLALKPNQTKKLFALLGLLAITTLLLSFANYAKYSWGADAMDKRSLDTARSLNIQANDVATAQKLLNEKLIEKSIGASTGPNLAAVLFTAMETSGNANIETLSYAEDGLLSATLMAPRIEDINMVLIALQKSGYKVTATPRNNSAGFTLADITVTSS